MAESNTDTAESRTAVGEPAAARRTRAEGRRAADGITVTRWNLGLSLTFALTVVTGAFTLLWERTNALQATQIELVAHASRMEFQVTDLREDVVTLREDMVALREDMVVLREEVTAIRGDVTAIREDVTALREELRDGVAELREEIRGRPDLNRARETSGVGTQ